MWFVIVTQSLWLIHSVSSFVKWILNKMIPYIKDPSELLSIQHPSQQVTELSRCAWPTCSFPRQENHGNGLTILELLNESPGSCILESIHIWFKTTSLAGCSHPMPEYWSGLQGRYIAGKQPLPTAQDTSSRRSHSFLSLEAANSEVWQFPQLFRIIPHFLSYRHFSTSNHCTFCPILASDFFENPD